MHIIDLVLGSKNNFYSKKIKGLQIKSNLSSEDVVFAYKNGVNIIGLDLIKSIGTDSANCILSGSNYVKLESSGFDFNDQGLYLDFNKILVDCYMYESLFLHFVKVGNKNFEYEIIRDNSKKVYIGGSATTIRVV